MFQKVRLPKTNDMITALRQIGILRFIQLHSPHLARVWFLETHRMPMPVVAVELHDNSKRLDKGVNTKLLSQETLRLIRYAQGIQNPVTGDFRLCSFSRLLQRIHRKQLQTPLGIGIAARERAIRDSVGFLSRRRPAECFAAYHAKVVRLIASLPDICVLPRAKESLAFATFRNVHRTTALCTSNRLSCLPGGPRGTPIAGEGAIALPFGTPLSRGGSAPDTGDSTIFV